MQDAKEPIILTYHFHKEANDQWILFSEWGGDIAYTPEIFEKYIRPHLKGVPSVGDHLFYGYDFSMDTHGFGKLPARCQIHFFGGNLETVKVALGGIQPMDFGVPVTQFTLRLPYMEGAPLIEPEVAELDPA